MTHGHISEEHLARDTEKKVDRGSKGLFYFAENFDDVFKPHGQRRDMTDVMLTTDSGDSFVLSRSHDLTHLQEDL